MGVTSRIGCDLGGRERGGAASIRWAAAEPSGEGEVLVSFAVSPGFSFDDWRLAEEAGDRAPGENAG